MLQAPEPEGLLVPVSTAAIRPLPDAQGDQMAKRAKLEALRDGHSLRDFVEEGPVGKRRLPVLNAAAVVDDDDDDVADEDESADGFEASFDAE